MYSPPTPQLLGTHVCSHIAMLAVEVECRTVPSVLCTRVYTHTHSHNFHVIIKCMECTTHFGPVLVW